MQLNRFNKDQDLIPKPAIIYSKSYVFQEAEQSEIFSTLKEETYCIIIDCQKTLKEQIKKSTKLEIAIQ